MIEEAIGDAFKNLNATVLGSMLVIVLVAFLLTVRTLRLDIKEIKQELIDERAAHQKTRLEQIADIRSLGNVTSAVESVKSAVQTMHSDFVEYVIRKSP